MAIEMMFQPFNHCEEFSWHSPCIHQPLAIVNLSIISQACFFYSWMRRMLSGHLWHWLKIFYHPTFMMSRWKVPILIRQSWWCWYRNVAPRSGIVSVATSRFGNANKEKAMGCQLLPWLQAIGSWHSLSTFYQQRWVWYHFMMQGDADDPSFMQSVLRVWDCLF